MSSSMRGEAATGARRRVRRRIAETGRIDIRPLAIRGFKTAATFTTIAAALVALVEPQPVGLAGPDASWDSRGLTRSRITMATTQATTMAAARIAMLQSVAAVWPCARFVPWPQSWTGLRSVIASARSSELNRAEREAHAAGYYEGLDRRRRRARRRAR